MELSMLDAKNQKPIIQEQIKDKKSQDFDNGGKILTKNNEIKQSMIVNTMPLKLFPDSEKTQKIKSSSAQNEGKDKASLKEK